MGLVCILSIITSWLWVVYREKFAFFTLHKLVSMRKELTRGSITTSYVSVLVRWEPINISRRLVDSYEGFVFSRLPTLAETYELHTPVSISVLVTISFTFSRAEGKMSLPNPFGVKVTFCASLACNLSHIKLWCLLWQV